MFLKFWISLLCLAVSKGQITFPDQTSTSCSHTDTTTEQPIPTLAETITFPPVTTASPDVTICSAANQCMDIGGIPIINMTGKMDVRVNNKGEAFNLTIGSNEQLTTPLNPGIPLVIPSQSSCPSNLTERCNIPTGLKCGTAFKPVSNYPDPGYPYIQYPWQGLVMRNDPIDKLTVYASGALITHKDFLTVANKLVQFAGNPSAILVRLGETNLLSTAKPFAPQEYEVTDVIIHSYYNPSTLEYDGAMLRLKTFVPLGQFPNIGIACLPADDLSYTPINCMVAGFGLGAKGENRNFQIREVSQPIIDPATCEARIRAEIGQYYHNADANLCAGGEIDKSNCDGDAGNPLVCNITGQWYVVGLASWAPAGQDCGKKPIPELYFNVATQAPWIQYVTSGLGRKFSTTSGPFNGGLRTTKGDGSSITTPRLGANSQPQKTTVRRRMNAITTSTERPTVQGAQGTKSTKPAGTGKTTVKGSNSSGPSTKPIQTAAKTTARSVQGSSPSGQTTKPAVTGKTTARSVQGSNPSKPTETTKRPRVAAAVTSTLKPSTTTKPKSG